MTLVKSLVVCRHQSDTRQVCGKYRVLWLNRRGAERGMREEGEEEEEYRGTLSLQVVQASLSCFVCYCLVISL